MGLRDEWVQKRSASANQSQMHFARKGVITEEMEKQWYEKHLTEKNNSFLPFTVINKADENIVGYFSLNSINWINRNAFVSGAIGEETNIGKGLGKEAVILLLNYGFNHLNLIKICAYVKSDHPALPLWKKLKAINEGTLKKHIFSDGEYRDVDFLSWFNSNY